MQAYPPTNICLGCNKPFSMCECNRYASTTAAALADLAHAAAHLHGAPGINWADTYTFAFTGAAA